MKRTFVYTSGYEQRAKYLKLGDSVERSFEREVSVLPEKGSIIPGTGGVRKIRIGSESQGMGKRGAYRFFYADFAGARIVYVLWILSKREQENISSDEKKALKYLIGELAKEVNK